MRPQQHPRMIIACALGAVLYALLAPTPVVAATDTAQRQAQALEKIAGILSDMKRCGCK